MKNIKTHSRLFFIIKAHCCAFTIREENETEIVSFGVEALF
jgi:hypothetical protein